MGVNIPGGNFPREGGGLIGGDFPRGTIPGENFPRTVSTIPFSVKI